MKQWTYSVEDEKNRMNNDLIFSWLDKYCPPEEWCIEISGGEPGTYPEIEELVNGLTKRGYYGLIKTNGTLPIPQSDTFKRIAAWHICRGLDKPPEYFDTILIIMNPNDCWEEKKKYCIDHEIPYVEVLFRDFETGEMPCETPLNNTFIRNWTVMYSGGQFSKCYGHENIDEIRIQNMSPPPQLDIWMVCPACINVKGFEIFLSDEQKQMLAVRRDNKLYHSSTSE
ncbi:MAG: hypothetical protein FWD44_01230 [Oscillospiraceae bacterium]|nr:hypothetical protein [Oscillospiraceae bacterium]